MEYKVKELKNELLKYGIETKGLKKCLLIELLNLIQNSSKFNVNETTENVEENNVQLKNETEQLVKLCNECSVMKMCIDKQVKEINVLNIKCEQLQSEITTLSAKSSTVDRKTYEGNSDYRNQYRTKAKILVLADDHGRGLSDKLQQFNQNKFDITVLFKPKANYEQVVQDIIHLTKSFNKKDYVIIIGGSNSIAQTGFKKLVSQIDDKYDTYAVNRSIFNINQIMCDTVEKLIKLGSNTTVVDINKNIVLNDYTRHGVHLNNKGKLNLCKILLNAVNNFKLQNHYTNLINVGIINNRTPIVSNHEEMIDPKILETVSSKQRVDGQHLSKPFHHDRPTNNPPDKKYQLCCITHTVKPGGIYDNDASNVALSVYTATSEDQHIINIFYVRVTA
ncbi:hypothetical protein FQR65_LT13549 [Abscondita terminalis]|nr:hypothetical protein FQR65_LT13549 [Abscondita terminalis]